MVHQIEYGTAIAKYAIFDENAKCKCVIDVQSAMKPFV